MAATLTVCRGPGGLERTVHPGDTQLFPKSIVTIPTVGAGTWTAAAMLSGYVRRTGSIAAYTDTTDTSANIMAALRGNAIAPVSMVGLSFEFTVANTVNFLLTLAVGRGVILGVQGGATTIAGLQSKDYLVTIQNDSPEVTVPIVPGSGNNVVTFALAPGQSAFPIGPAPGSLNITSGMHVTSGGGTALTTAVLGLRYGQGGLIGVTTVNNVPVGTTAIVFSPKLEINNVGLD